MCWLLPAAVTVAALGVWVLLLRALVSVGPLDHSDRWALCLWLLIAVGISTAVWAPWWWPA